MLSGIDFGEHTLLRENKWLFQAWAGRILCTVGLSGFSTEAAEVQLVCDCCEYVLRDEYRMKCLQIMFTDD